MKDTLRDNMWYEDSLTDYRKVMRYINEAEYSYKGIGDYMDSIRKRKDVEVIVKGDEGVNDLINVLKGLNTFSTRRKELVLRLYTDENDDKPRLTRVLSRDMMDSITNLIEELEGNAETPNTGFTFSDQDVMLSLLGVNKWSLKWEDRTIAEDVNGYFPYLNKSCLNLERYGIYKELKEENYSDNCLIHALKMSGLMSEEELNTLRSMMNTRYIKNKHLKFIAERFGLVIAVSRWNEEKKELMKPLRYGPKDLRKPRRGYPYGTDGGREIKLLARCNHYMIFDKTVNVEDLTNEKGKKMPLNRLLNELFKMNLLEEIDSDVCEYFMKYEIDEDEDLSYWSDEVREVKYNEREVKNVKYVNDIEEYLKLMKKQNTNKVSEYNGVIRSLKIDNGEIIKNFKTFCPFDVDMNEFFEDLRNEFGIEPMGYDSLSGYTFDAFKKCGCLDGVYEMTGKVSDFFRKCIKGGLIYAKPGVYKDVVCVDINSSYGAAMMKMKGVPKGRPKIFYDKLPDRYDYFVAMVENEEMIEYVDMWEYRRGEMKIIKGYYFDEGVNDKLHEFVNRLYELKKDNGKSLSKVAKFMIAQIYGKCIPKGSCEVVRIMNEENFKKFRMNNSVFISRYEKMDRGRMKVWSKKEICSTYIIPQLALQILSLSKIQLMNAINEVEEGVYKIYTDSITMSKRLFDDLKFSEVINDKLGGWKIEYEATKLEIFNKQSYMAELINGERRIKGTTAKKIYEGNGEK
ncbi:MAG: hypothetical protein PUC22_03440 [Turicibacter sp.]|nr:hypothetical protein [Turicibacter sp.]